MDKTTLKISSLQCSPIDFVKELASYVQETVEEAESFVHSTHLSVFFPTPRSFLSLIQKTGEANALEQKAKIFVTDWQPRKDYILLAPAVGLFGCSWNSNPYPDELAIVDISKRANSFQEIFAKPFSPFQFVTKSGETIIIEKEILTTFLGTTQYQANLTEIPGISNHPFYDNLLFIGRTSTKKLALMSWSADSGEDPKNRPFPFLYPFIMDKKGIDSGPFNIPEIERPMDNYIPTPAILLNIEAPFSIENLQIRKVPPFSQGIEQVLITLPDSSLMVVQPRFTPATETSTRSFCWTFSKEKQTDKVPIDKCMMP